MEIDFHREHPMESMIVGMLELQVEEDYYGEDLDIKLIIEIAKIIDNKLGTKCESELIKRIKEINWEAVDHIKYECKDVGFHSLDFTEHLFTDYTIKDLEVTLKCTNCETEVVLKGKTKPLKEG